MLMTHPTYSCPTLLHLTRLISPRSVALVGASPKNGSLGLDMLKVLEAGRFEGNIFPVNPNYAEIGGHRCYPDIASLPTAPDLAIIGVGTSRIEGALSAAIAAKAGGAVIFDSCYAEEETGTPLLDRLKATAQAARFPVCGGNGMGFYNFESHCMASFQHACYPEPGHIAAVVHSGSVFVHLANNDPRLRFNFIASPGQEISGTVADYIEHALTLPSTRVIALFIEAVRDPARFVSALQSARRSNIPVVALKAARTAESAKMAATHSAAIAGDDAAFQAVCDKYGVSRVYDLDELTATAQLFATGKAPGKGGLGWLTDSGGLRELMMDLASDHAVPLASLSPASVEDLKGILPHGLAPVNPIDAAGPLNEGFASVFAKSLDVLFADEGVAQVGFEFEVRDDFVYQPQLLEVCATAAARHGKPFAVVHSLGLANNRSISSRLLGDGVPLINGIQNAMAAFAHVLRRRDHIFTETTAGKLEMAPDWQARIAAGGILGEHQSLELLASFGLRTVRNIGAASLEDALSGAAEIGYPVVLKSAAKDLHHKSDAGGVHLDIASAAALETAYADLSQRLGPDVLVQEMLAGGTELAFGAVVDPQFGPLVVLSAGGVDIEVLDDKAIRMAPVSEDEVREMIGQLRVSRLLHGHRGRPAADMDQLARAVAQFSRIAAALASCTSSIDINPVIVSERACVAVDALIALKSHPCPLEPRTCPVIPW